MPEKKEHTKKPTKLKTENVVIVTKAKVPASSTLFGKKIKKANKLLEKSILLDS